MEELVLLKAPYFHLAVGEKSYLQKVSSIFDDVGDESVFVGTVEGNKCNTLEGLFSEFAEAFEFPDYFGYNWAAFDECLNDLGWLSSDAYLLLLTDIDKVLVSSENSFKVLVKTLVRSVGEWTQGRDNDSFPTPPTPFHIVFQCTKEKEDNVKLKLEQSGLSSIDTIMLPTK